MVVSCCPSKEDQESLSTQIKEGSVHPKQKPIGCKTTYSQVSHKQRADFRRVPWCVWGYWTLSRSLISYPDRSKCYSKQTPCRSIPMHLKEAFQQEIDKMLKAGVLKPVHEATQWINSFWLVEGKDKLGNLKLRICLDPINLNKAIVREPYHFKTPEDIAHLLADACIMSCVQLQERLLAARAWWSFILSYNF